MKLVRENINEKFKEVSDPIKDMGIGHVDLLSVYKETVVDGLNRWYKFLSDLDLIGKKVTFKSMPMDTEHTIVVSKIKKGELPNAIYLYDENGMQWPLNIKEKLIINE